MTNIDCCRQEGKEPSCLSFWDEACIDLKRGEGMNLKKYAGQVLIYFLVVSVFLAATWWGSRAVTVISQEIPVERDHTIVIDAGHGGEDGGAVSCTGVKESTVNLEIALRLNDLLRLMGYRTQMIRTTDISVYTSGNTLAQKKVSDLKERVRIVNQGGNTVLLSIHQNTYSDAKYAGAQIFYAPEGDSKALADALQTAFRENLNPGSSRESKQAEGIYLMEHIRCTGVLVECGFLSNPGEEARLRDPGYQQRLAVVLGTTVSNYLDCQTND